MFEHPNSNPWRSRAIAFAIVLFLHVGVVVVGINVRIEAPIESQRVVHFIDIPIERPQQETTRIVMPKLPTPTPPQVHAPELLIEETPIVAPADNRLLAVVILSADASGNDRTSSGGDTGEAGTGEGGSGYSAFTTCTRRVMPLYPSDAKVRSATGRVTLLVQLDERGTLTILGVAKSSGWRSLDEAGVAALKRWKCSPVMENGRAVSVIVKQEFDFSLRQ